MAITKNRFYLLMISILVLAIIFLGFIPEPINVSVAPVVSGPLSVYIEEQGKTQLIDRYVVSAPMAGYARRIHLDVGDQVERGAILAEMEPLRADMLDPRSHAKAQALVSLKQSSLMVAEAGAKATAAEASYSSDEFTRLGELYRRDLISREQHQQAQKAMRLAQAAHESALHNIDVARFELANAEASLKAFSASGADKNTIKILAPVNGVVLALMHESEGVVDSGHGMIQIGNPELIELQIDVLSEDAVKVSENMPVLIERWGGNQPLEGRVRRIEPVGFTKVSALGIEEQRVNVIVDIVSPIAQWQSLGDAYRVEAKIILWQADSVLQLPSSAVFKDNDVWSVFTVTDGRARKRTIEKGKKSGLVIQVISGLKEGEQVITYPDTELDDGSRIRIY